MHNARIRRLAAAALTLVATASLTLGASSEAWGSSEWDKRPALAKSSEWDKAPAITTQKSSEWD